MAKRLYPNYRLKFIPLKGAIIVRGTVGSSREAQEVIEIAEQYYPQVLNHLVVSQSPEKVMQQQTPELASKTNQMPPVVKQPQPVLRTPAVPPAPVVPASFPSNARDVEIDEIRADIKALHKDVRGLIELLQSRKRRELSASERAAPAVKGVGRKLLYFYADYSAPCREMMPTVRQLANEFREMIVPVDITAEPHVARQHDVDRVPSFVLLVDGQVVKREIGLQDEFKLRALLNVGKTSDATPVASPINRANPTRDAILRPADSASDIVPKELQSGVWLVPVSRSNDIDRDFLGQLATNRSADHAKISVSTSFSPKSKFAESVGVSTSPTLLLMKDGEVVDRLNGPATAKQLKAFVHGCDNYLSRASVPFDEASVVAIRRINEEGYEVHAIDYDVGVIIASEPGRSIIAVPAGVIDRDDPHERMLVHLFPGTDRERRIAADVLWDVGTILKNDPDFDEGDLDELTENGVTLLEIQNGEQLPVCRIVPSPSFMWDGSDVPASEKGRFPHSFIRHGEPYVAFRPREINGTKPTNGRKNVPPSSQWVSVVCHHKESEWASDGTLHRFKADFSGGVIAINKEGEFVGFGQATPQDGMLTVSSVNWGRSTVNLVQSLDLYIAWYFGTKERPANEQWPVKDPLVLSAVHPDVLQGLRDLDERNTRQAAIIKVVEDNLGLIFGDPQYSMSTSQRKKLTSRFNGGLLISDLHPNSPTDIAGIRNGDILLGLNGYETLNLANVEFILRKAAKENVTELTFQIMRRDDVLHGKLKDLKLDAKTFSGLAANVTMSAIKPPSSESIDARRIPPNRPYRVEAPVDRLVVIQTEFPITKIKKDDDRIDRYGEVRQISEHQIGLRFTEHPGISNLEVDLELQGCPAPFRVRLYHEDEVARPDYENTQVVRLVEEVKLSKENLETDKTMELPVASSIEKIEVANNEVVHAEVSQSNKIRFIGKNKGRSSIHYWLVNDPIPKVVEITVPDNTP